MRRGRVPDLTDADREQLRLYRLPCEVTGVRAMLHMRNNGLIAPPLPAETIAEATLNESILIRRE